MIITQNFSVQFTFLNYTSDFHHISQNVLYVRGVILVYLRALISFLESPSILRSLHSRQRMIISNSTRRNIARENQSARRNVPLRRAYTYLIVRNNRYFSIDKSKAGPCNVRGEIRL